ncbi:hypothetical protein Tco_0645542 [Tanacetum coccineum]
MTAKPLPRIQTARGQTAVSVRTDKRPVQCTSLSNRCNKQGTEYQTAAKKNAKSARQIPDKGDLIAYWVGISSAREFLGTTLSYTSIRDPMLRFCHSCLHAALLGEFVARLAEHFGLLIEERIQGLTVIIRDLLVIDMAELRDAVASAPKVTEGAHDVDEGAQAVLAPVQAPQPPPTAGLARTIA